MMMKTVAARFSSPSVKSKAKQSRCRPFKTRVFHLDLGLICHAALLLFLTRGEKDFFQLWADKKKRGDEEVNECILKS